MLWGCATSGTTPVVSEVAAPVADGVAVDAATVDGAASDAADGPDVAEAEPPADTTGDAEATEADTGDAEATEADTDDAMDTADSTASFCPNGQVCVSTFPFTHKGDTSKLQGSQFDAYSCKPGANESGPEQVYRVTLPTSGFLSVAVHDDDGVDIDVHILSALSAKACLGRGHHHVGVDVGPGVMYVVADTFANDSKPLAGGYTIHIGFVVPSKGPCALQTGVMARVNDGGKHLAMPAQGPIVLEAHLVTQQEPPPYPATYTDELATHYALSQDTTGLVMYRTQKWAPLEGGSFYGAGIGSPKLLPVLDEGWYVNMYWTKASRPPRGTRMILRLPGKDRAVVVSAGHETGPGNLAHVGGTPEESHFYLGTEHLSPMTIGIATNQQLPFGPRLCTDSAAPPKPAAATCPADMVVGQGTAAAFCIDRYEAPNKQGAQPLVMYAFTEADKWCTAAGKRLCFDDEWTAACQGKAKTTFPYGNTHQPGVCQDAMAWKAYDQTKLNGWPWTANTPDIQSLAALFAKVSAGQGAAKTAAAHVQSLYQAAGSGTKTGCVNEVGAYDLTGNVEEWTRRRDGGKANFHGNLKGRYWADVRTCADNIKSHGDSFRFYEIGFRCCADAK